MRRIALIIGAQKCGTTSLFNYLAEHPQVCACTQKEPFFFADDQRFSRGLPYYFSLWNWQDQHQVALEASPTYTMQPMYSHVAQRIAQVEDIQFSFLYIMRNPLERIESHVIHSLSTGYLKEPKVTNDNISFTKYAYQLDSFAKLFGKHRLHLLRLENLKKYPQQELRKIYHFLGIDTNFECADYARIYNGKDANHNKLPPYLKRLYKSPTAKATVGRLPQGLRRSLYRFMPETKTLEFKLSDWEKDQILQQLKPDLIRLHDEYGVNFQEQWPLDLR